MDSLNRLRKAVKDVLNRYVDIKYAFGEIQNEAVFDDVNNRYIIVSVGWDDPKRVHGCLLHVDIIDGKIWIQTDFTEEGIADELESEGIQKSEIVLAFHDPDVREYTGYAAA